MRQDFGRQFTCMAYNSNLTAPVTSTVAVHLMSKEYRIEFTNNKSFTMSVLNNMLILVHSIILKHTYIAGYTNPQYTSIHLFY